jgi:hypothetical protein
MKSIRTVGICTLVVILMAALVLSACQPTPEKAAVVGKNDGKLEKKLQQTQPPEATTVPYEVPERLDMEIEGLPEGYSIIFNAGVEIPDQDTWPVYTVEPAAITQEQADAIRTALIGEAVLYKPGEYRSREEIQHSIDYYEEELAGSEGYPELIDN